MNFTISWQPGALLGYNVSQTSGMIVEALQRWQSVSRVRFYSGPNINQAQIKIYPYSGNMNGAFMGAYIQTGQIIYTTNVKADREFCVLAFQHEIYHVIMQAGHVDREEALMYWRGSSVRYFDHIEARQVWQRYGKFTGYHYPYSLTFVGRQVQARKKEWEALDKQWKDLRVLRDAEKNQTRRQQLNNQVLAKLAERNKKHDELVKVNTQWLRLKKEWDNIGGIRTLSGIEAIYDDNIIVDDNEKSLGICECFKTEKSNLSAITLPVNMEQVYKTLPNKQVAIPGL